MRVRGVGSRSCGILRASASFRIECFRVEGRIFRIPGGRWRGLGAIQDPDLGLGLCCLELGFSVLACRDRRQVVRLLLVGEQLECLHEFSVVRAPLCQGAFKKPQRKPSLRATIMKHKAP